MLKSSNKQLYTCGVFLFWYSVSMFITKCDICEKEIKGEIVVADVGRQLTSRAFCISCAKPVVEFINKVKGKENGKQKRK